MDLITKIPPIARMAVMAHNNFKRGFATHNCELCEHYNYAERIIACRQAIIVDFRCAKIIPTLFRGSSLAYLYPKYYPKQQF